MPKLSHKTKELVRTAMRIWRDSTDQRKVEMQDGANTTVFLYVKWDKLIEISYDRVQACILFLRIVKDWRWISQPHSTEDRFKDEIFWTPELPPGFKI